MKFRCDCDTHIIKIDYDKLTKKFSYPIIGIAIYEHRSPNTGRLYKKPKLLGDVVIMNNKYPKELDKIKKYFKKIGNIKCSGKR